MVSYISTHITFSELQNEIREICKFQRDRAFTIKFIDDENDPCTISSQEELDEAIYLYEINKDTKITIHSKLIPLIPFWSDSISSLSGELIINRHTQNNAFYIAPEIWISTRFQQFTIVASSALSRTKNTRYQTLFVY